MSQPMIDNVIYTSVPGWFLEQKGFSFFFPWSDHNKANNSVLFAHIISIQRYTLRKITLHLLYILHFHF